MTLGQKLAGYRKLSGMTQQQLGEYLNISAQAISKWEKDLSEPALATLRTLAELYKVSVDELLDPNAGFADVSAFAPDEEEVNEEHAAQQTPPPPPITIGFCMSCGITVTEANLGATTPVVICQACLAEKQRQEKMAAAAEAKRRADAQRDYQIHLEVNRSRRRNHRTLALCIAAVATALFLGLMIFAMTCSFHPALILLAFAGGYAGFTFAFCMFYDCFVQEVVVDWFDKSLNLPGLIFTFDLDGIAWLIGMKILFWFIGLLFGILTGFIGVLTGLICAPFVFPFLFAREHKGILAGEELDD